MKITKEQIEEVLRSDRTYAPPAFAQEWTEEDDETFTREVLKLALAHLDSTRARRVGEAVIAVLSDFGWDHAVLRANVESGRLAETVEGCVMLAAGRALRGEP